MHPEPSPVVVLMGVSGAGKTTVGVAASALSGVPFLDADDLHPTANVEKMRAGIPLDDGDRAPWLDAVAVALRDEAPCIMACSALRRAYRDRLRVDAPHASFVLLQPSVAELERRVNSRPGHFMPAALLASQLAALEAPDAAEGVIVLDADRSVDDLAHAVATLLSAQVD